MREIPARHSRERRLGADGSNCSCANALPRLNASALTLAGSIAASYIRCCIISNLAAVRRPCCSTLAASNALDGVLQPLEVEEAGGDGPDANKRCTGRDALLFGEDRRRRRQVFWIERVECGTAGFTGHLAKLF